MRFIIFCLQVLLMANLNIEKANSYDISSSLIKNDEDFGKLYNQYKNKINDRNYTNTARVQLLNKITTKTSLLDLELNKAKQFGNLKITLLSCWKSPPQKNPESKALLKISETIPNEEEKKIFYGWMFASNPAFSSLQHPVYYLKVLECAKQEAAF